MSSSLRLHFNYMYIWQFSNNALLHRSAWNDFLICVMLLIVKSDINGKIFHITLSFVSLDSQAWCKYQLIISPLCYAHPYSANPIQANFSALVSKLLKCLCVCTSKYKLETHYTTHINFIHVQLFSILYVMTSSEIIWNLNLKLNSLKNIFPSLGHYFAGICYEQFRIWYQKLKWMHHEYCPESAMYNTHVLPKCPLKTARYNILDMLMLVGVGVLQQTHNAIKV